MSPDAGFSGVRDVGTEMKKPVLLGIPEVSPVDYKLFKLPK